MKRTRPTPLPTPNLAGWLTARDVAVLLQIRPRTVVLWVRQGRLPAYRLGRRLRFRAVEIEQALAASCRISHDGEGE